MTAGSVITDRVAEMDAAMAKEPPGEVMGAFGREQPAQVIRALDQLGS